jgi:hypothetical protein
LTDNEWEICTSKSTTDRENELFSGSTFGEVFLDSTKTVGDYFTFNPLNKSVKGNRLSLNKTIVSATFSSFENVKDELNFKSTISHVDEQDQENSFKIVVNSPSKNPINK